MLLNLEQIRIDYFGRNGKLTELMKKIREVPTDKESKSVRQLMKLKILLKELLGSQKNSFKETAREWFDPNNSGN